VKRLHVLELRSVVGSGGGPEKTILLGSAGAEARGLAITVCYIRDLRDTDHDLESRARALGVDYVDITERHSFDWSIWPALKSLCRERGIEIVHSHDYKTDLLAWMLARALGIVPLATAHAWVGHTWRERAIYYPGDKWILSRFPRVIAVSREIRSELIRTGTRADRIDVVLNGIDPDRFRRSAALEPEVRAELGLPASAFVLGAVGRLEPQKRFDLLIEAFARLRTRHPPLHLLIAGRGSLHAALQAQIDSLALGDSCRLLGHYQDVPRLHHALDMLVQSSDYEGTPNVVLEAMAMQTPVVATDAGGTAELIESGTHGLIVRRNSALVLEEAVESLIADPARREHLRRNARERVEGPLSFAFRVQSVERIYHELVRSRGER
jgi:glycosyltransferase involved in cell wall biosynthesis